MVKLVHAHENERLDDFVLHTAPVRLLSPFFSIGNFSSKKRNSY